jgi:hypothetical protein
MMAKKKKGHGGLKFMAFVAVVVLLIVGLSKGAKTEVGQRITGQREDRRLENTRLTPRFGFASAKVRIAISSIYNVNGAMLDVTETSDMSIDHQSARASAERGISSTETEVAPGVSAVPYDAFRDSRTEILTNDYQYVSPHDEGEPWTRSPVDPWYYGTAIDEHFIPMIDDLMGFEIRQMPTKTVAAEPTAGFKRASLTRPAVNAPTEPSDVTRTYSYDFDIETYRRVLPILAGRTNFDAAPDTVVTVTIGFDDVGLLRFADVSIPSAGSTTLAQALGNYRHADYHYVLEVTEISGEPITIDIPANFVDEDDGTDDPAAADPADPAEAPPGDTVPVVTP